MVTGKKGQVWTAVNVGGAGGHRQENATPLPVRRRPGRPFEEFQAQSHPVLLKLSNSSPGSVALRRS